MSKKISLQDNYLNEVRKEKDEITIFLTSGVRLKGTVSGFDSFTILMEVGGKQQLIFKHSISTIISSRRLKHLFELPASSEDKSEE